MSKNKGSDNERLLQKIDRFLFGESRHSRIKPVYAEKTMEELYAENEELKKANNRSNSLQKKYLTLFNSAPIAYFIFDTEFTIIQANQTAARLFRMEKFRFAGLPFNTLADEESHDILSSFQGRILSRKSRERCELKMKSKDGKEFYAMLESVPVFDDRHDIIQILSILSDITEYKHAEIAKRKQHLQTAINNVIDPFAVLRPIKDESGNIIDFVCEFINEAGLKTTKLSRKENKGKRILSIYPYFMESGLFYDAVRVLETGTALIREPLKAKCPAAGLKLYTSAINKLDDSVIITWRDITEKRRMEEALKESNEKYKSMFENIPIGAYSTTSDGRILMANPALINMLGYNSFEELSQRNLEEEGYENQSYTREDFKRILEESGEIKGFESAWLRRDGEVIYVRENARIVKHEDGVYYYEGTVEDISDIKSYQQKLESTLNELERSNQDLEHFAYVASHDLQEPLRVVTGYIKLFSQKYKGKLDEKADEYVEIIIESIDRMQALIKDLLKYARITSVSRNKAEVDFNKLVEEIKSDLEILLAESNVNLTHSALPQVKAEPTQMRQLLQNLISNAIKFRSGDKKPEVEITARKNGREWIFTVKDNGIGIEKKHFERIFMLFQRLHEREAYPGTGIGLAVCKRIVDQHGGRIWVESKAGEGSAFHFTLPAK